MNDVKYYEHGIVPMDWNGVMDRIEQNRETAIVHDRQEGRFEVWIDGKLVSGFNRTLSEAQRVLQEEPGESAAGPGSKSKSPQWYRQQAQAIFDAIPAAPSSRSPAWEKEEYGRAYYYAAVENRLLAEEALNRGDLADACSYLTHASRVAQGSINWYEMAGNRGYVASLTEYRQWLGDRRREVHPMHRGQSCLV